MACLKDKAHSIASAIGFPAFSIICGHARQLSRDAHSPKCELILILAYVGEIKGLARPRGTTLQ
jgi:hypothetical protein